MLKSIGRRTLDVEIARETNMPKNLPQHHIFRGTEKKQGKGKAISAGPGTSSQAEGDKWVGRGLFKIW